MTSPDFVDRAHGAFLGLALGDGYGRPLEFLRGAAVRTAPVVVEPGAFMWTDDTHMSLFLAEAVLRLPDGAWDEEAFGHAVGERFVAWLHDPLTPTTAPGRTCLNGAHAYERLRDWHRSGDAGSDGCGAVMRIAPVGVAFGGDTLLRAARVSAVVTHAHPNAVEAAVAGAWLLGEVLGGAALDAGLVQEAAARLRGPWHEPGGTVADALEAAAAWATTADAEALDEAAIPPGDGGWRSGSALGLALAGLLRWPGPLERLVDRCARIDGDSDSVAAIAGMYWGAVHGRGALPPGWVRAVPERATIEALTARLVSFRQAGTG